MVRWTILSANWMPWNTVGFCWRRSFVVEQMVRELQRGAG